MTYHSKNNDNFDNFPKTVQPDPRDLPPALIEITRFIKTDGPLTKHIHLTPSGALGNDSSDCRMARGTMIRERLDWRAFAALIEATPRSVAYALGAMRPDLPETIRLVTKKDPQSRHPGFATRTKGTLLYPRGPALVLCDFDTKGMPAEVRSRLRELGGFLGALTKVCAGFGTAAHVRRKSTSANIVNELTGVTYQSHGQHLYILVQSGSDARRFLYTLHDRCWLAGLGWYIVGNAGQLLERSIVDRMVCAPERLVFEASPDLEAPLRQERREAIIHDGAPLDTLAECRELSGIEKADLDRRKAEAARALGKETGAAKKAFVEDRVERAVAKGMDRDRARLMAEQWGKRILCPGVSLCFDDPDLGEIDVADVLRDPGLFDGATLADPIEGIKYGRNCAIIHGVQIFSFAHGGARYRLQHDYPSVKEAIEAAPETEACAIFVRLAIDANLDPVQEKLLAKAAGDRSGAGVKIAEKMLVVGRAQRHAAGAQAVRDKARSESSKERIEDFTPDGEIGPVMSLIDGILSGVDAPEPPMRDAEGWPIEVQCREAVGLHGLTRNGANAEESAKSRLPSPKHFLLTRHERESLEIEWGDHLCFVQKTRDGERHVAPPDKFLNHYLKYRRSELPRAHAVLTMPLVLPDGSLLAGSGLDRERRAVLRIEPALLGFMPKSGDREVAEAFNFLMDDWLVDVATDAEGKCVLIAFALSIIERVLLPERPVFFVTAGLRGGGKTTVLMMIALAAIGVKAAAAAWSSDPNERRKALFSYLLEGLPVLIWDNIPRGAAIGCPHIERASTCEFYQDRILGVTKTRTAPAYTIQAFTGNNIGPKSDQASRSLEARLRTDRPDPENRHFQHPDPIAWTLDHRGEILRALYTILLGNPQLDPDRRREPETRFKTWWTLVGSAIEHAAGTAGKPVSFKSLFERVEAADEEASARADTLQTLYALFAGEKFTSANLLAKFGESAVEAFDGGQDEDVGIVELKRFCTPRHAKTFSVKSIGHALGSLADAPVCVAGGALSLRSKLDGHDKIKNYWLEFRRGKVGLA